IQAFDAAIRSCDVVLRKEPQNFKALFRKGRALIGLGNADEAIPVLKQVLDLVPHSAMVASELQLARTMQQNERERWSRVARRMSPHTNYAKRNVSFRRFSSLRSLLPCESSSDHPQCSLSPLTERRLINLEKQLSSLVAMQMMRLNGPVIVKSCSQPPTSLAIPAPIQSPATTATPLSSAVDPFCANDTKLDHTPLETLRSNEVNRGDLAEDDEILCASDEKQPSRMNGTNGVKIRHARSKSSGPLIRKLHDSRSQAVCKPSTVSTVQNNQLACHDVDGLYHTALADEEHPPGAPKRPAVNVKTVKSSTPHPM
ncbi:Peptidyl-prolyl cis-trans isomerase FKBP8, partial [Fasciolopsis buskii]